MKGRAKFGSAQTAVWKPSAQDMARSRLARAMKEWGYSSIEKLHQDTIDKPEWFWPAALKNLGIAFDSPYTAVSDSSKGYEFPKWFPGAKLNAATHCVTRWAQSAEHGKRKAVTYEGDNGSARSLTYAEFGAAVDQFASGLVSAGIKKGDRVAIFMPVIPEAAVVMFAAAKIGAIAVPAFSGYGPEPLAARLQAAGVSLVVTVDGTTRRGKRIPMKDTTDGAVALSPTVKHVVVVKKDSGDVTMKAGRDQWWHDFGKGGAVPATMSMDANDPMMIIYTSGTTGKPKGIVHSHLGFLLKAAVDFGYAFDVQGDDVVGWIADMGWMLGPLMAIGTLQFGAQVVMIEGLPDFPDPHRLWNVAERNGITFLGIAPTAARGIKAATGEATPPQNLSKLRAFASTGEAWDVPTWHWLFEKIGRSKLPIMNYSGGTETGGGIISNYTMLPQTPASFAGPLLGMDVDVYDADAKPTDGIGELVVLNTWPGMTHSFWEDSPRYLSTYWERWPKIWVHGDLASINAEGYWIIHGRSDDTIKIAGRRVGPAEIESALVTHPGIAEAAAIGVPDPMTGARIVAFVVLKQGSELDSKAVAATVIKAIGKANVPSELIAVPGLPKTKNGKIMRRAIRARFVGEPAGDMSALDALTPLDLIPIQKTQ